MIANPSAHANPRPTPASGAQEAPLSFAGMSQFEHINAEDQLSWTEAADTHLLRLVMCAAFATLTLALVSSLA